jgi:hypothetical protein
MSPLSFLLRALCLRLYADENQPASTPSDGAEDFDGAEQEIDWAALNESVTPGADEEASGEAAGTATPTQAKATPTPTPVGKGAQTTPTPKEPPPKAPPVPGQEPAEKEETEEEKAAKAAEAAKVQPPPQVPLTPEQEAENQRKFQEWEAGEIDKMTAQYAAGLSDDDVASLQTEPEKVLPRLAAQIRMDTMKATISAMGHLLPQLMNSHQQANSLETQAQNAFFGANEDLRDVPMDKIIQAGRAYRQMNPEVKDPNEVIQGVGDMVRSVLKRQKAATPPPASGNGSKGKGYKPAGGGGRPSPNPEAGKDSENVWSELADD